MIDQDKSVFLKCFVKLDGVEGFEPPNIGTKNRGLTAWRYPNIEVVVIVIFDLVAETGFEPVTFGL